MLAGVAYTLSPMTAWFGVGMAALFAWAGRGLGPRERRWVFGLLSVAVAARLTALIAYFFVTYRVDGSLNLLIGDESYVQFRSLWLREYALGLPMAPSDYAEIYGRYAESGLLYMLAYVQLLLGRATYGIRLLNVFLFAAASAILYRTVRRSLGSAAALPGFALVLFLPSLFAWSISALKEAGYLFFMAAAVGSAATLLRPGATEKRILAGAACALAIYGAGTMRFAGEFMVGAGIIGGLAVWLVCRRPMQLAICAVLLTAGAMYAIQAAAIRGSASSLLGTTVRNHIGHVKTPGWGYKVLDPDIYSRQDLNTYTNAFEADVAARYVLRAAASFVLVPLPWKAASPSAVAHIPEQVAWYLIVLLAVVGTGAGLRQAPQLTCMLLCIIMLTGAAIALTSGNVGTLIRHRAMVLFPTAWLGGVGAHALVRFVAARCAALAPRRLPTPVEA